jgi:hypothetical protein
MSRFPSYPASRAAFRCRAAKKVATMTKQIRPGLRLTVLRPLALMLVAIVAAFVAMPTPATHAQMQQAVASPLTTKRLERLLRVYVSPTAEEATAIDRLHEAYLAKFRAELDPEIQAVGRSIGGAMPSQQEFEKFLRDLDRLQAKISEADGAFFDSAADLIAEERRPGMQRIREARDRQRNLSGFTRMGPMMFGGGGSFVDLADLLARDEIVQQVPEASREQFDALLRSQEQRLLAQSRNYGQEIRKAFDQMFAIISEAEQAASTTAEGADGADGAAAMQAQMARMQAIMQRMKELGKEANRVAGLNADANRAAVRQFALVLPELAYHKLRGDLANRATGAMGRFAVGFGGGGLDAGAGDLATLLARLRRDPEVTAEMRARFEPIEIAWRRERADNAEQFAEFMNTLDTTALMMGGMNPDGSMSETMRKIQSLGGEKNEIDQRAYRAVAAVIGAEKSEVVFSRTTTFDQGADGADVERASVLTPNPTAFATETEVEDAATDDYSGYLAGAAMIQSAPPAWSTAQLARLLKPLGVADASLAVLEGIVDDWNKREWEAKVAPLGRQLTELSMSLYNSQPAADIDPGEGASFGLNPEKVAKVSAARRQLIDAILAADAVLVSELGTALGLASDSAEVLILRLDRVQLASEGGLSGARNVVSPAQILSRANLSPEAARAFIEGSREGWIAFADSIAADVRSVLDRGERQQKAMESARQDGSWQTIQQVMASNTAEAAAFARRYNDLCDAAAAKASDRAEVAAAIKRARLSLARPDVYKTADCATRQLDAAIALDGVSDDQRARLEALKAEYDAVYELLSEKIAGGGAVDPNDGEAWRAMQERIEAEQKLFFQRNERTEKARSEARRILGDELAARVRGLVPDEADAAKGREANRFDPFAEEDD